MIRADQILIVGALGDGRLTVQAAMPKRGR